MDKILTVNNDEVRKFTRLSKGWHDPKSHFSMLHKMNQLRIDYIKSHSDILNMSILDIGCGGGILSESLAELGGNVTAIDPCQANIEEAKLHSSSSKVNYTHTSLEEFSALSADQRFDIVCIMEVVEHVDQLNYFIYLSTKLLATGGKIFFSTINKTLSSYILAIVAAEYILKMVPRKTHDWNKFVKPSKLAKLLEQNNVELQNLRGMKYNILTDTWQLKINLDINYIGYAIKKT